MRRVGLSASAVLVIITIIIIIIVIIIITNHDPRGPFYNGMVWYTRV